MLYTMSADVAMILHGMWHNWLHLHRNTQAGIRLDQVPGDLAYLVYYIKLHAVVGGGSQQPVL